MSASTRFRSALFDLGFYTWTLGLLVICLPVVVFLERPRVRKLAALWMRGVHRILAATVGLDFKVNGLENLPAEPVIIASKHQSAFETMLFQTIRTELVIGLKHELKRIPLFGFYLARAGNIFIDRGGAAKALRSLIKGAREAVAQGQSILIFPEGTRTAPGSPPRYMSGVAGLYAVLDVPVVPVALNSGLYWPRGRSTKRPGTIAVTFLEPIPPGLPRREFMSRLESTIETETNRLIELAANEPEKGD